MRFKFLSGILLSLWVIMIASCDIINPAEPIPARIQVNTPELQLLPGQGSERHKITELWTFADSNLIGVFGPPTEIPLITEEQTTQFVMRPGIRNNGILDDAIVYPLMTEYVVEVPTVPGMISVINPVISYKPNAVFSLVSDFETQNDFIDNRDTIAASMLNRSSVEPFEGSFSGEIIMTAEARTIEVSHAITLGDLPTDGTPAFLEFHYKTELQFEIGLLGIPLSGQPASLFFYGVRPNDNWNKIYIELTNQLVASDFSSYKILFRAFYPQSSTQPSYKIQLDNIKVVHL